MFLITYSADCLWLFLCCLCLGAKIFNEKQIEEIIFLNYRNQSYFFKNSSNFALGLIFLVICLILIKTLSFETPFSAYCLKISSFLLGILILFRRSNRNHNSLEEIYCGYLSLVIILFSLDFRNQAFLVASLVYMTSLSAGICKTNSNIWGFIGSRDGFIKFLCLPTLSRVFWVNIIQGITQHKNLKNIILNSFSFISIITPAYQILVGLFFIFGLLFSSLILIKIAFILNLLFVLSLFAIADLNWITSFNVLLSIASLILFKSFSLNQFNFNVIDFVAILYFISAIYALIIPPKNKNHNIYKFDRLIRLINFSLVPFDVYSEPHIENICSYFIKPHQESLYFKSISKINAFQENGFRSNNENFRSIHLHALVYTFTNYANHIYFSSNSQQNKINTSRKPSRYSWQTQLDCICQSISPFTLKIYQHVWDNKSLKYKKNFLFSIDILNQENIFNLLNKKVDFNHSLKPRIYN